MRNPFTRQRWQKLEKSKFQNHSIYVKFSINSPAALCRLCNFHENSICADPVNANSEDIQSSLWKAVFYRVIDDFRKRIKAVRHFPGFQHHWKIALISLSLKGQGKPHGRWRCQDVSREIS
jgi:hypothetical protein